jgi:acetylornithine deacetylase
MKSVVDHLMDLIRIPSVSARSNRPIIEYAEEAFHQSGWHSQEYTYRDTAGVEKINLVAACASEDLQQRDIPLAFVCHTDTVPYSSEWKLAVQPYESNGLVYGCGACDVKGFLASLLAAIETSSSSSFPRGTRVILTADEEIGCVGASQLIASTQLKPRRMVIGEPTSLHPARAGKGYALAEFTIHGKEAHSALPANGYSAIYGASRLIAEIEKYAAAIVEDQSQIFSPAFTTVNVGTIAGGTAKNVIAGACKFLLEWRPIPNQAPDLVFESVKKRADTLAATHPQFRYSANLLRLQLGFETDASSALVQTIEKLCGKPATSIPFGSEASLFAPIAEEVVVFGPGNMQTAHSDRECVPVAELEAATACLKSLMSAD